MISQSLNKISNWIKATFKCCCHPALKKSFCGPLSLIFPELFKFIFLPETVSTRVKSDAIVPKGSIFEGVAAILFLSKIDYCISYR